MSSTSQKRKKIQKKFKNRGYNLKFDALDEILVFADQFPDDDDGEAIDLLLDNLQETRMPPNSFLSRIILRNLTSILKSLGAHNAPEEPTTSASSLAIIDAFLVPKDEFDRWLRVYVWHTSSLPIHGEASAKTALYRERFMLLSQRVSRAEHFSRPAFDAEMSQFENNEYKITTGFFTENTIILAEGEMQVNGIFQVITCGFPPLEDRDKTLKAHSEYDFFGGGTLTKEEMIKLADLERQAVNDTFVILSDIWLDDEEVMRKLETVLDGFESVETVPSLFVFMGNFCSRPCNLSFGSYSSLREQFGKLGRMIGNHPRLKENSRFLFIPGPEDAGPSTVLPRCALPKYLTEELRNIIPNAIFSSNPCRVKFYNQEIVFFRQDLLYRMRRSCLVTPSSEETNDPFKHLVYTITHQSHLCPLPLMVQPIIWNYDHALRLYPTPHTIVLGDKSEQEVCKFGGTTCFNPGSFSTDSTFVAYRPSTQEVELSAL
ncbi:DNA polymerase epsilon subunit B-like protein [Arabidopsis thaliana]|nr:DNA polymerase epsilon subunit B-like protein [Arabidopsis thaliana]